MKKYSVITSVYKKDKPEFVRVALDSMLVEQTVKPSEIVLVRDGQVTAELNSLINEYEVRYLDIFNIIRLEQNGGLGKALQLGVEKAKYDIIARMDSDDICLPNRFEVQLKYLNRHPEVDIVGGQMTEFIDMPENIIGERVVPCTNDEIYDYMKKRCALNHVTVMFRKEAVIKTGNYQDWFWNEDYYLWVRMMMAKCKFANVPEVLVNVRSGADQYARRGGMKYFNSEVRLQKYMLEHKMISWTRFIYNIAIRWTIQIAIPNNVRGWIFIIFARKNSKK